jgi:signal transduction histidine kinase
MTEGSGARGYRWSLRAWLSMSHFLVLVGPIILLVAFDGLARQLHHMARAAVFDQAVMLQIALNEGPALQDSRAIQNLMTQIHDRTGTAVHVVDLDGRIRIGAGTPAVDLGDHPQVAFALADTPDNFGLNTTDEGFWTFSAPIVAAFPIRRVTRLPFMRMESAVGAIVLSRPAPTAWLGVTHLGSRLAVFGGGMVAFSLLLALLAARRLARPLVALANATDAIAEGRFDAAAEARVDRRLRIDEIDTLLTAFVQMSDRLQRRLGWIREFASNVSHEFKTPLATLQGTVELLQDTPDMPAEQRERFLENAAADLERMDRMVAGLMELAEAEEMNKRDPIDLDQLLHDIVRSWDAVRLEGSAGSVRGDHQQLESVFRNLVHNAVQHGGPDVTVRVVSSRTPRKVTVQVIDNGKGISTGNQPKVFERFFTTARSSGGTGLGLALVRTICEAHGGGITLDSRPGHTAFTVTLPVRPT